MQEHFTKFETARILGARALQIAMDAPLLLKISDEDLKAMKYDSLRIAEKELNSGILPIAISRPMPRKHKEKLTSVKEERVSDEEIVAKEQEVEKEIVEDAEVLGFVASDEVSETEPSTSEEQ
ncbi:DNA-directed RNA polymerase subunit K [Candidatus Pacearchaeota archaeon]|nr:DNA-directed RNA polymerase subunit K [Candidatus Pacearchaeota archaeon]